MKYLVPSSQATEGTRPLRLSNPQRPKCPMLRRAPETHADSKSDLYKPDDRAQPTREVQICHITDTEASTEMLLPFRSLYFRALNIRPPAMAGAGAGATFSFFVAAAFLPTLLAIPATLLTMPFLAEAAFFFTTIVVPALVSDAALLPSLTVLPDPSPGACVATATAACFPLPAPVVAASA